VIRIVVKEGFSRDMADLLLNDMLNYPSKGLTMPIKVYILLIEERQIHPPWLILLVGGALEEAELRTFLFLQNTRIYT
jgi:hypothetical protein